MFESTQLQAMHIFINHKLVDDCTVVDRALGRQQLKRTTFFSSRIKSMAMLMDFIVVHQWIPFE